MTKSLVEQQTTMAGMSKDLLKSQRDRIQLKNQLPNEHQHNIDMYGQMSEATGYKQRPNEPWRALLDGMFKGMAMGEKSEMSKKAKENYDTLEKGTAFIMDNLRAGQQMLADLNKKEQIKETISGYVSPIYTAMMAGADRQKIDNMGRPSFVALQDQGIIPQGAVYLTIDTQSKTLIYNKEDGSKGYTDLIPYVNQETMDMNKQRIEQMGMDARMMSAEASQVNAQAHMMSAHTGQDNSKIAQERLHLEQEYAPKEQEDRTTRLKIMQQNANQRLEALGVKSVKEIAPKYEAAIMGKKICEDLIKEATDNPQVFGSTASAVVNTKGDSNALRLWAEKTFVDQKQRSAAMRVAKGIASLQLQDAKAMGGQNNMTLDAMIQQMIPNGQYDPDNFIYIMEEFKNKYQFRIDTTRDFLRQPHNAYIGNSYDNHMADFENRSKTNRDKLDNPNKFSNHSPEQLQIRKQQLEQEIMSKK